MLRSSSVGDKSLTFWGFLCFGVFGGLAALSSSGVVIPELSSQILFAVSGLLLSIGIVLKPRESDHVRRDLRLIPLLVFLLILLILTIGLFSNSTAFPALMLAGYSPLLFVAARPFLIKDLRHAVLTGSFVCYTMITIFALAIPDQFFGQCRLDKCSVWGQSIGSFSSGNAFGLVLSGLGFLLFVFSTRTIYKIAAAIGTILLIDAASGRTSLIAFIATVLVLILIRLIGNNRLRKNIIVAMVLFGSFAFVLIPFGPESFTFRGELWIYAKSMIPDSLWFGYGASEWVRSAYSSGIVLNYSTHNIWLEAFYVSGVVGFLFFLTTLTFSKSLWGQDTGHPQIGIFLWILIAGMTEVPAFVARPYIFPALLLTYYFIAMSAQTAEDKDSAYRISHKKPLGFRNA
jgi:hypothetical protein